MICHVIDWQSGRKWLRCTERVILTQELGKWLGRRGREKDRRIWFREKNYIFLFGTW